MLVSSIVGFNFGNTQVSAQNQQKAQSQQSVQSQNNNLNSCCPKGRKSAPQAKQQNQKLSILA